MSTYTWFIIGAILLTIEMATGTFYLLMLAIAAVAAWLISLTGASFFAQSLVFLIVSTLLVILVNRYRAYKSRITPPSAADQLDAGAIVTVSEWHNGIGQTHYRGAVWQTVLETPVENPPTGLYCIVRFEGTRLLVAPV